jgi:hypothetical protein
MALGERGGRSERGRGQRGSRGAAERSDSMQVAGSGSARDDYNTRVGKKTEGRRKERQKTTEDRGEKRMMGWGARKLKTATWPHSQCSVY